MNTRELIIQAKYLIQDIGFCKNENILYSNPFSREYKVAYNLFGALYEIYRRNDIGTKDCDWQEPWSALENAVSLFYKIINPKVPIDDWNDDPLRTKSDIIYALNQMIEAS